MLLVFRSFIIAHVRIFSTLLQLVWVRFWRSSDKWDETAVGANVKRFTNASKMKINPSYV